MEVLVIGGSKFSGKKVVELLVENEYDVTVLNRGKSEETSQPYYKLKKHTYPKEVNIIHADRKNREEFASSLSGKKFSIIIDMCVYDDTDVKSILDFAPNTLEQYIAISTASVYDDKKVKILPIPESAEIGPENDEEPIQFIRDKRKAETLLKKSYNENAFPSTVFRPTYIYGPFNPMYREMYFFDRIMDKKPIYMPGTGECLTDFILSYDLAWLLTAAIGNKKAIGQFYNATGEGGTTLNTYVNIISDIIGNEAVIIHYDPEIMKREQISFDNWNQMFPFIYDTHLILNKEKAVMDLDYKPTSFYDGIKLTYEWYLEMKNPEWKGDYTLDRKLAEKLKKS